MIITTVSYAIPIVVGFALMPDPSLWSDGNGFFLSASRAAPWYAWPCSDFPHRRFTPGLGQGRYDDYGIGSARESWSLHCRARGQQSSGMRYGAIIADQVRQ